MTGAAMGFLGTAWTIIFIAIAVTLRPLLKHEKNK